MGRRSNNNKRLSDAPSEDSSSQDASTASDSAHVLSAKYLERHSSTKDLVARLQMVVKLLGQDRNIEPDSPEYPGLGALCQALSTLIDHRDKQVRLFTVSACMELFAIYAPDAPWSTEDTLEIFRQTVRQLANLAHTTSERKTTFREYFRILELLAEVKIGVLLVDLTKDERHQEEALQVLAELFRTLLQSVRHEHPSEIVELVEQTVCGCLEEYYEGVMLPVPLIDEILICIGQGPKILVVNPQLAAAQQQQQQQRRRGGGGSKAAKNKKNDVGLHVEQPNPCYVVAAAVVRKTTERLSTPIATLLNGLLNNDSHSITESCLSTKPLNGMMSTKPQAQNLLNSSQADIWSIIYELHRIAPSMLTTVIGNLVNFLTVPDVQQRQWVVQLLGRIFVKSPKFAMTFRPCFRDWIDRAVDNSLKIRMDMVTFLLQMMVRQGRNNDEQYVETCGRDVQVMLKSRVEKDASPDLRMKIIHAVCDACNNHKDSSHIHLDLWLAVGSRVGAKHKQERKDTLTGLAQTYYRQFIVKHLRNIQEAGDDCDLSIVQDTLREVEELSDSDEYQRYHWIPTKIFESACFSDDVELQTRVWKLMDDVLLGSNLPNSSHKLTATARAVGLMLLINDLGEDATSWMRKILSKRAKMQTALSKYLTLRSEIKNHPVESQEATVAHIKAQDVLENVGELTNLAISPGERNSTLEKFHVAKDKRIFRILSTIVSSVHSTQARVRALDELPKRVKSLGDQVVPWMKVVIQTCSMGDFINLEVIHHCILLSQELAMQGDWSSSQQFLTCVEEAAAIFPQVCASQESSTTLFELLNECLVTPGEDVVSDITTSVSSILAKVAPSAGFSSGVDASLQKHLLRLCCKDGTPEQGKYAVSVLAALINPSQNGSLTQEQTEAFSPLLNALTSPSRLRTTGKSQGLVCVLAALTELSNQAPTVLTSSRGQNAVKFALEKVLLKTGTSDVGDEEDESSEEEDTTVTPKKSKKSSPKRRSSALSRNHQSPVRNVLILGDQTLSVSCRTLCAAIEFLGSYIRSSLLSATKSCSTSPESFSELIERFFDVLSQIVRDQGLPPSSEDRRECRLRQDRAVLRQSAAIQLLQLSDRRLLLDQKFLTPSRWHTLASVFLDDEQSVRETVLRELMLMLTGQGAFGQCKWTSNFMPPKLRFLAFVALCTDGEKGADHSAANANAANVGKLCHYTKADAMECISHLRKSYEMAEAQASAQGPEAERLFEMRMKVALMPEYVVPFAFHMLASRKETPVSEAVAAAMSESATSLKAHDDEGRHRMLRKRLKCLFDTLVVSLGEAADNISLLLRMSEKLGKDFRPVQSSLQGDGSMEQSTNDLETAKLRTICVAARDVLLSYVKKDVNLSVYPGNILIPPMLFKRTPKRKSMDADSESLGGSYTSRDDTLGTASNVVETTPRRVRSRSSNSSGRSRSPLPGSAAKDRRSSRSSKMIATPDRHRVKFSPARSRTTEKMMTSDTHFSGLSPIGNKCSPMPTNRSPGPLLSSGEKTRGTTPPSVVRNTRFSATASLAMEVSRSDESHSTRQGKSVGLSTHESLSADDLRTKVSVEQSEENKPTVVVTRGSKSAEKSVIKRRRVPLQIKIVRKGTEGAGKNARKSTRKVKDKAADDFDFETAHPGSRRKGSRKLK